MKKLNSYEFIALGLLIVLLLGVILFQIYRYNALQRETKASYCIPKGYSGVYYSLDKKDNVAITVLNLNDPNQAKITAQLNTYFKGLNNGN